MVNNSFVSKRVLLLDKYQDDPPNHLMNKIISMYRFFHVRVNAQI